MTTFSVNASIFDRPNRIKTPDNEKNTEEYHVRQAKFAIATNSHNQRSSFLRRIKINKSFYKGGDNQWIFDEDTEAFLKDDTNQERNRIRIVNNVIRPIVSQFKGNANRLDLNVTTEIISEMAQNRMTEALNEKMFKYKEVAAAPAVFKEGLKDTFNVGDSKEETQEIFINEYGDEFVKQGNNLINYIERINRLDQYKIKIAEELSLSGLAVMYGFEKRGHLKFEPIESEDFIFDNSARRYDLTDSDFMGMVKHMLPTDIYETYNLTKGQMEIIESYANNIGSASSQTTMNDNVFSAYGRDNISGLQIQVFKMYFKDTSKEDWGYVIDEYGYKHLVRIGFTHAGEEAPRYTEADVVDYPKTSRNEKMFKKSNIASVYNEVLRYCYFIPSEFIASAEPDDKKKAQIADIVLDYGVYPHQGVSLEDPSDVKFPFKAYTWGYIDGEIISPIDDAISPQRFINRVLSVTESNINNSGGSNTVIDQDALDPEDVEDGTAARDIKQGKPIFVRTKGKGVPNAIGHYDNTPKEGVYKMFDIIPVMKDVIQSTTGVNEPLQGGEQKGGGTQLVGVTELLIQRGSLMQEPFYKAIEEIFIQMYEMMVTDGKKLYVENERLISNILGDKGAHVFKLSKEILNEDLRVFVKRENSDEMLKSQANETLMIFLERGLIDQKMFADLFNRSTPTDVAIALRKFTAAKLEAEKQGAARMEQQAEQEAIEQEADAAIAMDAQVEEGQRAVAGDIARENNKSQNKEDQMVTQAVIDKENP